MFRRSCLVLALACVPSLAAAAESKKKADKPTVAVFRLDGAVIEEPRSDDFSLGADRVVSLKELVERIDKASGDANVKAIVLLADKATIGTAQREELREAIGRFRAAGKDVYAHADELHMGDFALLAGVTRLSVVPTTDVWVTGLYGEQAYLRGLLDKLGVTPEYLTCGEYKSAAETFMRKEPSPQADKMMNWLFDGLYDTYVTMIAKGRKVDAAKVKGWIDNGPYVAEKAKALGMIDAVEHRQAFEKFVKSKCGDEVVFDRQYGEKKPPELDLNNPLAIFKLFSELMNEGKKKKSDKPAVGIVYVNGAISLGRKEFSLMGGNEGAYSTNIRKALDEAARDDAVKAVVLRVDSPGGSAVASEIILDATKRVKAKKPLVVSMGDVAGSGGYYVACGADTIFADSGTITGSIGVLSGKFYTTPMWDKVGLSFKGYKRGAHADILSGDHPMTKEEREKLQGWMDEIYGVFKHHVTEIRGDRLKKPIDELAGGRVFTGKQALELGLVDKIGSLDDAVKFIAKKADLSDYDVRVVPEPKNIFEQIMESTGGTKDDKHSLDAAADRPALKLAGPSLLDLAAPQLQGLDPARVKAVKRALVQLQTLHREGVCLMMPEFIVR